MIDLGLDLTPFQLIDASIIVGIPVLFTRVFVGLSRPRRTSKLWTFGLPTLTLMAFFVRVSITRNLPATVPSDDWISAASWLAVVVSQAWACFYQWLPPELFRRK